MGDIDNIILWLREGCPEIHFNTVEALEDGYKARIYGIELAKEIDRLRRDRDIMEGALKKIVLFHEVNAKRDINYGNACFMVAQEALGDLSKIREM